MLSGTMENVQDPFVGVLHLFFENIVFLDTCICFLAGNARFKKMVKKESLRKKTLRQNVQKGVAIKKRYGESEKLPVFFWDSLL